MKFVVVLQLHALNVGRRMRSLVASPMVLLLLASCTPGVRVVKNPSAEDNGIRFYRPKPYLKVVPAEKATVPSNGTATTIEPSDEFVQINLEYLPDFAEEYSIRVDPALGSADVDITLDQGWNLTSVNQDLDTKFSENVNALTNLLKAATPLVTPERREGLPGNQKGSTESYKWVVRATDVPLGYYEAVLERNDCGDNRLLGWKYVGFAPYGGGIVRAGDQAGPQLFGLVFREGVMVFEPLQWDMAADPSRKVVPTGRTTTTPSD